MVKCQLHCFDAARITRPNLSNQLSEMDGERSVNKGVTLLAPRSVHFSTSQSAQPPFKVPKIQRNQGKSLDTMAGMISHRHRCFRCS